MKKRIFSLAAAVCLLLCISAGTSQAEGFARYVDIAATDFGYIAVTEDGQVKGFDLGRDVLFTDFAQGSLQAQLEALTDIVDVETSWKGILALRSDGSAVYLGDDAEIARQVDNWRDIVSIAVTPDGAVTEELSRPGAGILWARSTWMNPALGAM